MLPANLKIFCATEFSIVEMFVNVRPPFFGRIILTNPVRVFENPDDVVFDELGVFIIGTAVGIEQAKLLIYLLHQFVVVSNAGRLKQLVAILIGQRRRTAGPRVGRIGIAISAAVGIVVDVIGRGSFSIRPIHKSGRDYYYDQPETSRAATAGANHLISGHVSL